MKKVQYYCDKCGDEIKDENLVLGVLLDTPSYRSGQRIVIKGAFHMDLCYKCYADFTKIRKIWDYECPEI